MVLREKEDKDETRIEKLIRKDLKVTDVYWSHLDHRSKESILQVENFTI